MPQRPQPTLPSEPVTLTPAEIGWLHGELRKVRHDINNKLANIQACVELVRYKPEEVQRLFLTVPEQSPQIQNALGEFTAEFEKLLRINRPAS